MTTTAFFDDWYSKPWHISRYPAEAAIRFLAAHRANCGRVLDIGCGPGRHVKLACEMGFETVGIDASAEAIRQAGFELRKSGWYPELQVGSMTDLPCADASFELAIAYGVFYYGTLADMQAAIAELKRVLRPGGRAIVVLRSDRDWRFTIVPADDRTYNIDEYGNRLTLVSRPNLEWLFQNFSPRVAVETQEFTIAGRLNSDWLVTVEKDGAAAAAGR